MRRTAIAIACALALGLASGTVAPTEAYAKQKGSPAGQAKCNVVGPVSATSVNGLRSDCSIADAAALIRLAEGAPTPDPQQCSPAIP